LSLEKSHGSDKEEPCAIAKEKSCDESQHSKHETRPSSFASYCAVEPALDELRSDPRFKDMLKRLNLPE